MTKINWLVASVIGFAACTARAESGVTDRVISEMQVRSGPRTVIVQPREVIYAPPPPPPYFSGGVIYAR